MSPVKSRSHKPSWAFLCVRDSLHSIVFTFLFPRYFKIMTASLFSVRENGTVTKAKSLFAGSLEISSKKSLHWKMPRNFATKIQWPEVGQIPRAGRGFSSTLAIWVCTSVARKSTVFQWNLYCKTIVRFSPSFRKNIQHST